MFQDNFNRADENLETSANWTRVDGTAGKATVSSNTLSHASGDETAYQCPDQGNADHYSQCVRTGATGSSSMELAVRLTDHNNAAGLLRNASSTWQLYKRVTSTFTQIGTYSAAPASSDVEYLEASGTSISVKINGTLRIGPITVTDNSSETRQGTLARAAGTQLWDDFEADSLGASGINIFRRRISNY